MKNVDHRTDIYSYALVLCELLTGKPNFQALESSEKIYPATLKKVIGKACSYDINDPDKSKSIGFSLNILK